MKISKRRVHEWLYLGAIVLFVRNSFFFDCSHFGYRVEGTGMR